MVSGIHSRVLKGTSTDIQGHACISYLHSFLTTKFFFSYSAFSHYDFSLLLYCILIFGSYLGRIISME